MYVKSKEEAWRVARNIFPTDFKLDNMATANAGYDIYYSTVEGNDEWISDLGTSLELNMKRGSLRIFIVEDKPAYMKVTVRSLTNSFAEYWLENVVGASFVNGTLLITTIGKNGFVNVHTFNSNTVVVSMNS